VSRSDFHARFLHRFEKKKKNNNNKKHRGTYARERSASWATGNVSLMLPGSQCGGAVDAFRHVRFTAGARSDGAHPGPVHPPRDVK